MYRLASSIWELPSRWGRRQSDGARNRVGVRPGGGMDGRCDSGGQRGGGTILHKAGLLQSGVALRLPRVAGGA